MKVLEIMGGPLDGNFVESDVRDKCLCAYPTNGNLVAFHWRNSDKLQFIKSMTKQEYMDRFAPKEAT